MFKATSTRQAIFWIDDGIVYRRIMPSTGRDDLSDMAELLSFSPPASESTIEYRTSLPRQARMRPKPQTAPTYI